MRSRREMLFGTLSLPLALGAQETAPKVAPPQRDPDVATLPQTTIRVDRTEVVAPVTVLDNSGKYVNGLEPKDFTLYDMDKVQDIRMDVSFVPISLVVAIQANSSVEPLLPIIKKIGPLLENQVIGQAGEAAIIKFDHRIMPMTDGFTNDGKLFTKALERINPGSSTSAMIDAVFEATRMLRRRPKNHRKILLLISETRDNGSEGRLREALSAAEFANVIIYSININRFVTTALKKAPAPRPDPYPLGARPLPGGAPMTPDTYESLTGYRGQTTNFVPLFVEIFRQAKAIFVPNPVEVFTQYTGGREFSFISQRTMEEVVSRIGEELHSQYLLYYSPSTVDHGGWHDIRVIVGRPNMTVRTRPGFWMAAKPTGG